MGCIDKIKEIQPLLSKSEKRIADYIIENKFEAYDFSIQELAELTTSSPSSVVRFVKKAGYESYTQFRLDLAKESERTEIPDDYYSLIEGINESDSIHKVLLKYEKFLTNTVKKTFANINRITLTNAINRLRAAKRVIISAEGTSYSVGEDLCRKLILIGVDANCFADAPTQLSIINNLTGDDLLITLSYSGNSAITNLSLKRANERRIPTISITQNMKSYLATAADIFLSVPDLGSERDIGSVASRTSMMTICDLLYLGIAKQNIDRTKDIVQESRDLLKQLKVN